MQPLFETIIDYIPAPEGDENADTQVLISTIDYNEYVGRIGVGKIDNGKLKLIRMLFWLTTMNLTNRRELKSASFMSLMV